MATTATGSPNHVDDDPTIQAISRLLKTIESNNEIDEETFEVFLLDVAYIFENTPELSNLTRALPVRSEYERLKSSNIDSRIEQVKRVLLAAQKRLQSPFGSRWSDAQRATMNAAADKVVREAIASAGIQDTMRAMLQDRVDSAVLQSKWIKLGVPIIIALATVVIVGGTFFGAVQFQGVAKVASESQAAIVTARDSALKQAIDDISKLSTHEQKTLTGHQEALSGELDKIAATNTHELRNTAEASQSAIKTGQETLRKHQQLLTSLEQELSKAHKDYTVATKTSVDIHHETSMFSQQLTVLRNMERSIDAVLSQRQTYDNLMADLNTTASGRNVRVYAGRTTYASWECLTLTDRCSLFVALDAQGAPYRTRGKSLR